MEIFKISELGMIKRLLPLSEMAISFGLIEERPKSISHNSEERKKIILYSRGQGCLGVLEDVSRLVRSEVDGGSEWKYPLSDLLWNQGQS